MTVPSALPGAAPRGSTTALRPIFIGGCPRSGTTLLGALLGAHSRCVCVPEMQFKVHPMHRAAWGSDGLAAEEVERLVARHPYFQNWGIAARPAQGRRFAYRDAVEDFVRRYAIDVDRPAADVWADHTPSNVLYAAVLLERFPDAVLLHIVRDGRGVASSLLTLPWGVDTVSGAARVWAEHLAYGFAAESAHPDRVFRVDYEELVREPERTMRRICERTGLDWEPQMGRETRFVVPAASRANHPLIGRPPDPARADAWRRTLTSRQAEIFESLAGSLLSHLGYALSFGGHAAPPTPRERIRETLTELRGELRRIGGRAAADVAARLVRRRRGP